MEMEHRSTVDTNRHRARVHRLIAAVDSDPHAFAAACCSLPHPPTDASFKNFAQFALLEAPHLRSLFFSMSSSLTTVDAAPHSNRPSSWGAIEERRLWHGLHVLYVSLTTAEEFDAPNVATLHQQEQRQHEDAQVGDRAASLGHVGSAAFVLGSLRAAAGAVVSELAVAVHDVLQWNHISDAPEPQSTVPVASVVASTAPQDNCVEADIGSPHPRAPLSNSLLLEDTRFMCPDNKATVSIAPYGRCCLNGRALSTSTSSESFARCPSADAALCGGSTSDIISPTTSLATTQTSPSPCSPYGVADDAAAAYTAQHQCTMRVVWRSSEHGVNRLRDADEMHLNDAFASY